ncbi:hypothetical protein VTJ04DRAFT_4480 [Mycothermus thermophilus]|uniref:uncharacterized protein n=1 Tax=Humicola insolens TaxID=85995 RepID=UPI00374231AB
MLESARNFIGRILHGRDALDLLPPHKSPSVAWLLAHREECRGKTALCEGTTPLASLYRMYEYIVTDSTIGLRNEIEFFFNKNGPAWSVAEIPDPKDPDPERYAILAVLPSYLVMAFNRLIEMGLPRGAPGIITPEMEQELRSRPRVLEREPSWASQVPALEERLVIPYDDDGKTPEEVRSERFLEKNILVAEPHVLFV